MTPQLFADNLISQNKQVGFNNQDLGQCTAIFHLWCAAHKLPFIVGNAVNMPNAADPKYFEVYNYVPGFQAKAGDGIVWAECDPIGVGANGHIDLYIQDLGNGHFKGLDQNWPVGSLPRYVTHTLQGVVKIIRIKQEYLITTMDKQDLIIGYLAVEHRDYNKGQVTDAEINGSIGKKPSDWFALSVASQEWLTKNDILLRAYPLALQQIADLTQKVQQLQANPTQQEIQQLKDEVAALTDTTSHLGGQ